MSDGELAYMCQLCLGGGVGFTPTSAAECSAWVPAAEAALITPTPGCAGEDGVAWAEIATITPGLAQACMQVASQGGSPSVDFGGAVCEQIVNNLKLGSPTSDWCDRGTGRSTVTFRVPGDDATAKTVANNGRVNVIAFPGYKGDTLQWRCDGMQEWQQTKKAKNDGDDAGVFGVSLTAEDHGPWPLPEQPTGRLAWTFE